MPPMYVKTRFESFRRFLSPAEHSSAFWNSAYGELYIQSKYAIRYDIDIGMHCFN